jgi:glyoxylase-like metal-dependent hydrolase (beta-lactamase superfamily II)
VAGEVAPATGTVSGRLAGMLQQLAGSVWWYPGDPDPELVRGGVGVIATGEGSVVVDAGQSPHMARQVQSAMRSAGLPDAKWLVYTHHHWDHTWGGCGWENVDIIGHVSGKELLTAEAQRPWSHEYLRDEIARNPRLLPSFTARAQAMPDWHDFTIVPPQHTFTDRMLLPEGIEVRHVGGDHAPDSTIVLVPDASVMLVGDCFYPPPYHLRVPGDGLDVTMARALLDEGYEWYVDSHSEPRKRTTFGS